MHTSQKILFVLTSMFLIWHTLALVIGPSPQSHLRDNLFGYFQPYLSLFRLNNAWAFYAPEPELGSVVNYKVIGEDGDAQEFDVYNDQLDRWSASYFRFNAFFNNIYWQSEVYRRYRNSYIQYLCRRHAALNPESIVLVRINQTRLTHEDYLKGARPLDPEFIEVHTSQPVRCQA
jgi:hypothetical protein